MEVREAVQRRRAVRVFDPRPVEEVKVRTMVEAMRLAPSCNNNQPWRLVVCSGEALPKIRGCLSRGNAWATGAPLILVLAAKPSEDCRMSEGRDYYQFGCGLGVGEMLLQATELGLIAHPIAGFDPVMARVVLGIPADYVVITFIICGYPGEDDHLLSDKQKAQQVVRPERRPIDYNFYRDGWGQPLD
ncbi:MAG: nitroreductase family protein [Methanomassiliicoccus sp.]|nr:nitroreductase family protein [Methanomassiliicoccus sp.]